MYFFNGYVDGAGLAKALNPADAERIDRILWHKSLAYIVATIAALALASFMH
jgi:hypothetical protein